MNHILKRKFHKKGYIINGVFEGTSLVEGTEVSGFSSVNNYILVPAIPANTTNFEIFLKVKFSNVATNQHFFNSSYTYSFLLSINSSGKLFTHISSNGTSWDIASNIQGVSALSKDVWYYIKCSFNGSEYKVQLSTDNKSWTDEITIQSTLSLASVGGGRIGSGWYDTPGIYITCDFSQCYININGQRWWDGLKRCKYDYNFDVVGTPNISNPPSCEVSGFSSANYLTLPENFDVSDGSIWEMVYKITTKNDVSTQSNITGANGNSYRHVFIYTLSSKLYLEISSNGSSWDIGKIEGGEILPNTTYFVKVEFTGNDYNLYYSKTNSDYVLIGSLETNKIIYKNELTQSIGLNRWSNGSNYPCLHSIDLSESYIKINGELWWSCFKQTENVVYKEDGNLSDYDFFDYKTCGLETRDFRKGYINNFFVVGAPTITNGSVVSGFSSSNYLRLPFEKAFNPESNPWEVVLKINLTKEVTTQGVFGYRGSGYFRLDIVENKLRINLSTSSSSWTIGQLVGDTLIPLNVDCWIKYEFTGEAYNLYYSFDGVTYHLDGTLSSTSIPTFPSTTSIGAVHTGSDTSFLNGSLDLSECYININGQRWWDGLKRCKYDYNFNVVGTPIISNPPSCEVSGFTSSVGLTMNESFSPVAGDTWEMNFKVHTSSNVSTKQQILGGVNAGDDGIEFGIYSSKLVCWLGTGSYDLASEKKGTYTVLTDTDYWIRVTFDGENYTFYYSLDGDEYIQDIQVASTSVIKGGVKSIGFDKYGGGNPFLGSIDLTQSYIKINGELWWSCFKQSDLLVFDEEATEEDYDFMNAKRHFLRHPTKRYYKIVPWEQPILTSNTSYGSVTGSSYSGSRYYYCISDGKIPTTNDGSDNWGTSNTAIGWVNWALPEEIIIKGIKIYNRSHTTAVDYTLTGARFYTDDTKTTPIGEEFEILTSQGIYELTDIPPEGIKTNQIYFYKTGSTYSGIGELEITAEKIVQSTYKDWDFYETIRELRKFYKNVSDYTHTATSGWSDVSNVFDGSADTYATCGTATDYIEIDFGKDVFIDGFVATGNWVDNKNRAEDLRLYTVDDSDMETFIAQSSGAAGTTTYTTSASFNRVKTSKIRFRLSETNNEGREPSTQYPTRIREININAYFESNENDYDFQKIENEKNIVYNNKTFRINPTPSNATVIINGEERNEIELMRNSSISWSVSLDGYTTQSGTSTLSEDTTIDVILEKEKGVPLWACYYDSPVYYYVKPPLSENSILGCTLGDEQVFSASEVEVCDYKRIISVDEETLVIEPNYVFKRVWDGDLYE